MANIQSPKSAGANSTGSAESTGSRSPDMPYLPPSPRSSRFSWVVCEERFEEEPFSAKEIEVVTSIKPQFFILDLIFGTSEKMSQFLKITSQMKCETKLTSSSIQMIIQYDALIDTLQTLFTVAEELGQKVKKALEEQKNI